MDTNFSGEWFLLTEDGERDKIIIKLKKVVGKAHTNVYEIVEIFKREQGMTESPLASWHQEPFLLEEEGSLQTKIKE